MKSQDVRFFLNSHLDFNKDLPLNVFKSNNYIFWFFERPLLDYQEVLLRLIDINLNYFDVPILMTFGSLKNNDFTFYSFDSFDEFEHLENLDNSRLEYPIIITNRRGDWLAFESSKEELGVIALKKTLSNFREVSKDFDKIFISSKELEDIKKEEGWYSEAANIFGLNYINPT